MVQNYALPMNENSHPSLKFLAIPFRVIQIC